MMPQHAFFFDASSCSGCKACQAACKDKNNLPTGVLWRRVLEVTGGTWQRSGEAWNNTVFAYNISIACNHCVHPKCAGICPANAYILREDGIVILDTAKCIGCGYCAWACPYGAPQYDSDAGYMTKCNLCVDQLEQGMPPTCVAACPLRVLHYGETTIAPFLASELRLWDTPAETHPFPLPPYSHTQPRLAIKPHPAMHTTEEKFLANQEEIQPRPPSAWEDVPLILFTLLGQMAVGGFWAALWMFPDTWASNVHGTTLFQLLPSLLVGFFLGTGMLASVAHLGIKRKALNSLANLRRSWLSREILFTALFGTGWLLTALQQCILGHATPGAMAVTAALGVGLVYSMAKVYRLPAVPDWNTYRTNVGFLVSALLLGQSVMAVLLSYGWKVSDVEISSTQWMRIGSVALFMLVIQLGLIRDRTSQYPFQDIRVAMILSGIAFLLIGFQQSHLDTFWLSTILFLIVLSEEGLGRWLFYRSRTTPLNLQK